MAMSTGSVVRDVAAGTAAVHSSFQPSRVAFFPCAALPARQRLCAAVTQSTPNVAENERSRLTSTAAYGFCRHKAVPPGQRSERVAFPVKQSAPRRAAALPYPARTTEGVNP